MKTIPRVAAVFSVPALLFAAGIEAQESDSYFSKHPLFKQLVGDWESSGSLSGSDGTVTQVSETWTGEMTESGALLIKGSRQFGDESHEFEWEYLYNATTELIEGVMRMSTSEDEVRLEVNVSEQEKTITLKSQLGGDGSELVIVNKVEDGKVTGKVKLTDPSGNESLGGEIVAEKKKS